MNPDVKLASSLVLLLSFDFVLASKHFQFGVSNCVKRSKLVDQLAGKAIEGIKVIVSFFFPSCPLQIISPSSFKFVVFNLLFHSTNGIVLPRIENIVRLLLDKFNKLLEIMVGGHRFPSFVGILHSWNLRLLCHFNIQSSSQLGINYVTRFPNQQFSNGQQFLCCVSH